ncbi:hypothetical protein EC973_002784 [Apophysomyces ossiformis]|uniref:separase n=1 Tax=Apophysomyces ossiformis TaxID=679940 RepID=A0A8H7BY75_9FUNG|nr:hypothetical protein EC973_002784 [Apophysomyces ossiformis]
MSAASNLLSSLKDFSQCNDSLTTLVRSLLLEPFQPDMSQPESSRQARKPSRQEFKLQATKLAPLAARIVNQNIESLSRIKQGGNSKETIPNRTAAINCLVDSAFYATAALKHMKAYTKLKPLDIEKTTSNLICKIVEVGEYGRALEELRKFRASLTKIVASPSEPFLSPNLSPDHKCVDLTREHNAPIHPFGTIPLLTTRQSSVSRHENDMLHKYGELLTFPLDTRITDSAMILLILAYQANVIRCWSDIDGSALLRHLPYYINKPGNFFEWCKHLMSIDAQTARKQLDLLHRLLIRASKRIPLSGEANSYRFHLQSMALKAGMLSGISPLPYLCDSMVRNGITFEKQEIKANKYEHLLTIVGDFMDTRKLSENELHNAREYFILCDFYAYVARKANNYNALTLALNHVMTPLRNITRKSDAFSYFHVGYAAHCRLSFGSAQIDLAISKNEFSDGMIATLKEAADYLKMFPKTLKEANLEQENSNRIMSTLCKSINAFRQSCSNLHDMIVKTPEKSTSDVTSDDNSYATPPRQLSNGEKEFGPWKEVIQTIVQVLDPCQESLSAILSTIMKKSQNDNANHMSLTKNIKLAFVDIMCLLSRIYFDVELLHTHEEAYRFLSDAEVFCRDFQFPSGYRWLSAEYYGIGTAMVTANFYSKATYALRKGCILLEKDEDRASTVAGRLHLCKRYETLGICCLKSNEFEDGIKAFRLALKRLPSTTIEVFVKHASSESISALAQQNPLIPKLIDRFLRSSIVAADQEVTFASDIMDTTTLSATQLSVLLECELKVLHALSAKMDLTRQQSKLINILLYHYTCKSYPIRRTRALLDKVRIERSKRLAPDTAIKSALESAMEAKSLLTSEVFGEDSNLVHYRQHYLALANSWIGICSHELNRDAMHMFSSAIELWRSLLSDIRPFYEASPSKEEIQLVHRNVDDIEGLYDHLRILLLTTTFHIRCLNAFGSVWSPSAVNVPDKYFKLNNGLRASDIDKTSACINIYAKLGKIYSERGYVGKASLEFSRAKSLIQTKPCSAESELTYLILHAQDLARAPNTTKRSQQILRLGKKLWDFNDERSERRPIRSARLRLTKMLTLADAYLVRSLIALNNDTLIAAIDDCKAALRTLNRCTTLIQNKISSRREDTAVQDPFGSKPIGNESDIKQRTQNDKSAATDIAFREAQWGISQKISACLRHLGRLHMIHGTWKEAQYCFEQGRLLGTKTQSKIMIYRFLIDLCDLQARSGCLEKCLASLEEAKSIRPKGEEFLYEEAILQSVIGFVKMKQNDLDSAIEIYGNVHELFESIMECKFIEGLDCIGKSGEDRSPTLKSSDVSHYNCWPLKEMQGCNDMQKAQALAQNGSASSGWELINSIQEAAATNADLTELSAISSFIRHMMACDELSQYIGIGRVPHEALVLPLLKLQQRHDYHKLEHADTSQALVEMLQRYQQGAMVSRVDVLQKLCVEMGFWVFFQHYLAHDRTFGAEYVTLCAYYLGTNIRREMQFCLEQKLSLPRAKQCLGENEWPGEFSSQDEFVMDIDSTDLFPEDPDWIQSHLQRLHGMYRGEHRLDSSSFQETFVDILPESWTVCSVTMDPHNNDLYISRMRSKETPFVVKLPLDRVIHRQTTHEVLQYNDAVTEIRDIIRLSDETIHGGKKNLDQQEINDWWMTRMQLDRRLKKLLERIENNWFSGFRGLLCGNYNEHKIELTKFQKLVTTEISSAVSEPVSVSMDVCRMMLRLGPDPRSRDVEDVIYFLTTTYKNYNLAFNVSATDIEKLTDRIRSAISAYHSCARKAGIDTMMPKPGDHVILILDKFMHMFPWESVPVMRPQAVSRLPCISFLRDRIEYGRALARGTYSGQWKDIEVDRRSAYYILNPGGDLMNTQRQFESTFQSMPGWNGIIHEKPSEMLCQQALMSKELYLYFGHSAGQSFLRGQHIRQLKRCSVALLVGCSSGALDSQGDYDPSGYVMNFLLGGSACVVANLWDVTDKSIDKVSRKIMSTWGLLGQTSCSQTKSLVESVAASRDECNLPYLIGAAPVVYGVPVYLKHL